MITLPRRTFLEFALFASLLGTSGALAAPPPLTAPGADLRLLFGGVTDGVADIGLEIALQPGWKTYWRHPGDAGIPPNFEAAGSTGIAEVTPRFPTPVRFDEGGLVGIGYTEPVILPLDVRLADPSRPAELVLTVQIGLCRDICVPLEAKPVLRIDPAAPAEPSVAAQIAAARARLPVPATAAMVPRIVRLSRDDGAFPPVITVEAMVPAGASPSDTDLFVEGPSSAWTLPVPEPIGTSGNPRLWRFALDGQPSGADTTTTRLRFTLTAGGRAVEQTIGLDGAGVLP